MAKKHWKKVMKKSAVLASLFLLMVSCPACGKKKKAESPDQGTTEQVVLNPTKEPEKFAFPLLLDSDRLELGSVFESTMPNPDSADAYGEEVAAIQLKNVSGIYLKSAKIHVALSNGDAFEFLVEEMPAGMELMAFDINNTVYDDTYRVEDVQVDVEYGETKAEELFSWSVSGSNITVENISAEEQKNVIVYYHCTIDGLGYGGRVYRLSAGNLQPGETATVTDTESFVGDVMVVNVTCE